MLDAEKSCGIGVKTLLSVSFGVRYERLDPHPILSPLVDCYWFMESADREVRRQKIIPDGYTELIFQFGEPYRNNLNGEWQLQGMNLLAGQIRRHFELENTGTTCTAAIKFKPAALTQLFGLDMFALTDTIADAARYPAIGVCEIGDRLHPMLVPGDAKKVFDEWLIPLAAAVIPTPVTAALHLIFDSNGLITVKELQECGIGERQMERLFRKYVGLSPKYFARIIRFNTVFTLMQKRAASWSEIVYRAGYYDQSHFIRDFKTFAGEDPSAYYFTEENMANFFLTKGVGFVQSATGRAT